MERHRFDDLIRRFVTRRAVLPALGSVVALTGAMPFGSAGKKNKKKATLCVSGQTVTASKKKKKKLLKSGATPGECPPAGCTPTCSSQPCGAPDGCGGVCSCEPGALFQAGICPPCSVRCTGSSVTCGNDLKTALASGGTVRVCPGRYEGNFIVTTEVVVIGAGEGQDPATNTILDANNSGRVLRINDFVPATLSSLRLTGGNADHDAGGILSDGDLTLTACTVTGNRTRVSGAGAIKVSGGTTTLNACTISSNVGASGGGGISNFTTLNVNGTAITGNQAPEGGGIRNTSLVVFDAASSVTGNTATTANGGGGIWNGSSVRLNGATVSGNTPQDIVDF